MKKIEKSTAKPYAIQITNGFEKLLLALSQMGKPSQIMIVTDSNVAHYYLEEVKTLLEQVAPVATYIFLAGENSKNFQTVYGAYDKLLEMQFDRSGLIVALGGGVVGDLAGFVASTYMRGVPFIQIPTTIVAQNDSSVGGKVGIDYHQHKNMVGAFYQPELVYINVNTLETLPEREVVAGLSEVIKHGLIRNATLYDYLKKNKDKILNNDTEIIQWMTYESCLVKVHVVEEDPKEKGIRKILNFGHTIGHAIETLSEFEMIHGECVGYGMAMAAWMSFKRGYLLEETLQEIVMLLKEYGLLAGLKDLDANMIYNQMAFDKKKSHGNIPFILLEEIGTAKIVYDIDQEEIIAAINWVKQKCE